MQFKEFLNTLKPLEDYEVLITLKTWEEYLIENKPWKQGSLRLVQNHLWNEFKTNKTFNLENFCEFYKDWQNDKNTHPTIWFLDKYNTLWWTIKRVYKNIPFVKAQGTWNDFIIIDFFDWRLAGLELTPSLVQKMCDRNFWIWSDGIVIIDNWVNHKFAYRMFNPDGSEAEMCWNGIRCYMKYLKYSWLLEENSTYVETKKWVLHLSLVDNLVEVDMWKPILQDEIIPVLPWKREVFSVDKTFSFTPVSMWNPHSVIFLNEELKDFGLNKYWKPIESNTDIFPKKVNVEFIKVNSKNDIDMRVFERWAWETLACWTWACASVVAWVLNWFLDAWAKVKVHLKWWDLVISWAWWIDDSVIMRWPAEIVFEGKYFIK